MPKAGRIIKPLSLATIMGALFLLFGAPPIPIRAQAMGEPPKDTLAAASYSEGGADTCLLCHNQDGVYPVPSLFKTPHAQREDTRSPFAQHQCESCHGPGAVHAGEVEDNGSVPAQMIRFGPRAETPVALQNAACIKCHKKNLGIAWHGSAHQSNDLSCASCHTIHADRDPVFSPEDQPKVCFQCHQRQRVDSLKPSTHPVRFSLMACSACHKPHGTVGEYQLIRETVNETCTTCHAEKRGPFLWEHAPVSEDCTLCHRVHGSNHPALLTKRPPFLCQQCHSQAGHPSLPNRPGGLPPSGASGFLLGGSCLNCHGRVHGSNHPSGALLSR